jgi:hypothetical protein
MLPVIFRREKDGTVIAFFPTILADPNIGNCLCYCHIGQHCAASKEFYQKDTRSASPYEYRELFTELVERGYSDLQIVQKWLPKHDIERLSILSK